MNARIQLLKQLLDDDIYVIDEGAVAAAIVLRMRVRRSLPDVMFRDPPPPGARAPRVRSFRPHPDARSFRLTRMTRDAPHPGVASRSLFA